MHKADYRRDGRLLWVGSTACGVLWVDGRAREHQESAVSGEIIGHIHIFDSRNRNLN